jgi:anti-sigma regulatory factor (Ser/Thr protein kinase)
MRNKIQFGFILLAAVIVGVSMYFFNRLVNDLADEERKKIEIWASATSQLADADSSASIGFLLDIIKGNTTIPVVIIAENDSVIDYLNFNFKNQKKEDFFKEELPYLKAQREPIIVQVDEQTSQYIYYDDSLLLKKLAYYPYLQFGVIFLFLFLFYWAFSNSKRSEQNRVWVGLSKETAHQLGTPISSLLAWVEILKNNYPEDALLPEMQKDVNRLQTIAERFSKIGSKEDLENVDLDAVLQNTLAYMRKRISQKVNIHYSNEMTDKQRRIPLNTPLFEWVIENLCKNAIDALEGDGDIYVRVSESKETLDIFLRDTGKGIPKSRFKAVFKPGYTTKKRGWGLGLSLVKRIVEEYHHGKIFVKHSEINIGTEFCIRLKK